MSCFIASKMGETVAREASEAGTFHAERPEAGILIGRVEGMGR